MKLVFAHDHLFKAKHNGSLYTSGAFNHTVWKRYLKHFDNVTVIARLDKNKLKEDSKYNNFDLLNTNFVPVPSLSGLISQFKNKKVVYEKIENELKSADALVARLPSEIGNVAISVAKEVGKPYVVEVVGCAWDSLWNYGSYKGKLYAPYATYKMKNKIKNAQYTIYVTNSFLQNRYPTRGKSENCSNVALTEFNEKTLKNRLNKIYDLDKNSKIIIGTTAAVNVKYKGQEHVIKALGKLKKQGYKNFEYQLVGDGDQSYLKSVIEKYNVIDNVTFMGPMVHNEVFEWLETIDIYAQPSYVEGLPRALIEAMSLGLPSFGSNAGGIPELLEEKVTFNKRKVRIKEICSILLLFTKTTMAKQAARNFEESKKYAKKIIEQRREHFFERFKKDWNI